MGGLVLPSQFSKAFRVCLRCTNAPMSNQMSLRACPTLHRTWFWARTALTQCCLLVTSLPMRRHAWLSSLLSCRGRFKMDLTTQLILTTSLEGEDHVEHLRHEATSCHVDH